LFLDFQTRDLMVLMSYTIVWYL